MTVSTIVQQTIVTAVGSVVLSAITQDPSTFLYLRTIQVYSPADTNGNVALQFTLTVSGVTAANVELMAPSPITFTAPSGQI
jgi:hypothetical protein